MPEAIHSKTRLSASPGLIGPEALLIAFSTSSSMALDRENLVTMQLLVFQIKYFRGLLKPFGYPKAQYGQRSSSYSPSLEKQTRWVLSDKGHAGYE